MDSYSTRVSSMVAKLIFWLRQHLAKGPLDIVLTFLWFLLAYTILVPLWQWAVSEATWSGSLADCNNQHACWLYVRNNWDNLIYGALPRSAVWRVHAILLLMLFWVCIMLVLRHSLWPLLTFCIFMPVLLWLLLHGGYFGLIIVPTQYWGGFTLNIILSILSIALAFPVAIVLLLARQSSLLAVRLLGRVIIEFFIGIPLIVHLFFATLVLPLFISPGFVPDKFIRVIMMMSLFGASYMAEVLRGGVQGISKAQFEAADSLGFTYFQKMAYVILPQAIQAVFPGLVNLVIALFKDSVLVSTVAMLDVIAMMQSTLANILWMPYFVEGYLFVGALFWSICFGASQVARKIEAKIKIGR